MNLNTGPLGLQVTLLVPVFSATDRLEAGTTCRVCCLHTYKDYRQAVDLEAKDGTIIREVAIEKVHA